MNDILLNIITLLYWITGIIVFIWYIPSIYDVYINKKEIWNIISYTLFSFSVSISLLYATLIIQDTLYMILSILNFTVCVIMYIWLVYLKLFYKKQ